MVATLTLSAFSEILTAMAKSKNHTAHNQSRKDHRNGLKKPSLKKHMSMKGKFGKWKVWQPIEIFYIQAVTQSF